PDSLERLTKKLSVFRHRYRACVRANQLHTVLLENSALGELHRDVESRLTPHRWKQCVGTLLCDNELDVLRRHRLDVGPVSELRIRHDGRRIRVDEDDLEALFLQRLRRLCTRIVELSPLTDDDRTGANNQNSVDVGSLRHLDRCDSLTKVSEQTFAEVHGH